MEGLKMRNYSQDYMTEASRELAIYAINDISVYQGRARGICHNLAKHMKRGDYDRERAVKGMVYATEFAAKRYVAEFAPGVPWHKMFTVQDRDGAAREMLEHYQSYIEELANA